MNRAFMNTKSSLLNKSGIRDQRSEIRDQR